MNTRFAAIGALCFAGALAFAVGSRAQAPKTFVVATIKPSQNPNPGPRYTYPPGRLIALNAPLASLVGFAHGGATGGVSGGPAWASQDRYDVQAQAEGTPDLPAIREMLQNLLTERFKVKFHRETKQVDVYAMVLARGDGNLGPAVKPSEDNCPDPASRRCAALITPTGLHVVGHPMAMLANLLGTQRFGLGRRVEDRTGLTGRYDVEFQFAPPPAGQPPDPLAASIFTAVQEQIGVKLESSKGSVEAIVIDSAERPSEN